jgi:hypothetical protein
LSVLVSLGGAGALGALGVAAGCSGVDESAVVSVQCPPGDPASFRPVSAVVEQRCGTLDCHGSSFRPLRIYGRYGLRRPEIRDAGSELLYEEYYPGGDEPTTDAELEDNLRSICGLEPELLTGVVAKTSDPGVLSFIRKPRLREKHKGGLIWYKGDPGDQCLTNWLTGGKDVSKCQEELSHP